MAMVTVDQFKGHGDSAVNGVHVPAGRAKAAMASKWNEFKYTAFGTGVHCPAKRRIPTVDHLVNVLNNRLTRM